jgi:hypothetical protein
LIGFLWHRAVRVTRRVRCAEVDSARGHQRSSVRSAARVPKFVVSPVCLACRAR